MEVVMSIIVGRIFDDNPKPETPSPPAGGKKADKKDKPVKEGEKKEENNE